MPVIRVSGQNSGRGLITPIAIALALKAAALTILYFAFFVPTGAPTTERTSAAIFALPTGR